MARGDSGEKPDTPRPGFPTVPGAAASDATSEHIMQFFTWEHLPVELQTISMPFGTMAQWIVKTLPRNPERTVALRKLLDAKDAAVRARVAK